VPSLSEEWLETVAAAGQRLRSLDERSTALKPAPNRWSKKEILGHLIDSAANNHHRFVRAQLAGELHFPAYEQEEWARCQDYAHADWTALIVFWESYNRHLAYIVDRIPVEKLDTPCWIGSNEMATLGFLIDDYLRHMRHHLKQLDREVTSIPST
jgi:DinB superfamily